MTTLHGPSAEKSGGTAAARPVARSARARWSARAAASLREGRRTRSLQLFLVLLVPVPFLLLAHPLHFRDAPLLGSPGWNFNADRSFMEVFGYVQLAAAVVLLVVLGLRRHRGSVYAGWAAALLVVVLDDSLGLHERGGVLLKESGLVRGLLGLPAQALAELVAWGLLGLPVLLVLVLTHRASSAPVRRDSWVLAGLVALLMAFAVGVDLVHAVVTQVVEGGVVNLLLSALEAAGELVPMTAVLAFAVHVLRRGPRDVGPHEVGPRASRP